MELEYIARTEDAARDIVLEELGKSGLTCQVTVDIPENIFSTGVQGDQRTYGRLTILKIQLDGKPFYDEELLKRLSNRITNELPKEPIFINRVLLDV